jgi:serine/threonine protein kinase
MDPKVVKKIGKYEITGVIGQGGMGLVYLAEDRAIGRSVAIKTLTQGYIGQSDLLERFYHEAKAGILQHPNIVTVFDLGDQDGVPFIVMEYVSGQPLDKLISSGRLPSLIERLRIVEQVCSALGYAHRRGVVHRDIKPSNVIVQSDGVVKIIDFGIARVNNSQATQTGYVVGTLSYVAPERIMGEPFDGRSDIFAVGIMLYFLLTGRLPFLGEDASVLHKLLTEQHPPLSTYISNYPPVLDAILDRALAKNPKQRYSTAEDFAADLSALIEDLKNNPVPDPITITPRRKAEAVRQTEVLGTEKTGDSQRITGSDERGSEDKTVLRGQIASGLLEADAQGSRHHPNSEPSDTRTVDSGIPGSLTGLFQSVSGQVQEVSSAVSTPDSRVSDKVLRPRVMLTFTSSADPVLTGKSVPVDHLPFSIGREQDADLPISSDRALSRQHCVIDWVDGAYIIRDLGSGNGTWVNGRPLRNRSEILLFGAVIRFSDATALIFVSIDLAELPDLTGSIIGDRFRLDELIRGSKKSALYRGEDQRLPQSVAVKLLSPDLAIYPGYLEQLNREASIAARVHHPHIARVIDYGIHTLNLGAQREVRAQYVCTEFMAGGSLANRIQGRKFLKPEETVNWLRPISDALQYAHQQNVVHCGLKATSVVFDDESNAYLTDFAVATHSSHASTPMFLATPELMAPEQWDGLAPTHHTDQYSLAVLTYYSLSGAWPFVGQQDPHVRLRNFDRGPVPVHEEARRLWNISVPKATSEVILRALSVKPENRFPSVRDFYSSFLASLTSSVSIPAEPSVFLSYRRDVASGWATLFARELRRHGISVFVDVERRDNVLQFPGWLKKAISNCDVFVCLLSATTLESKWVREEIRVAHENERLMVPVFQEDFKHPESFAELESHIETLLNYQGVTLLDRKNEYIDAAITKLAKMIERSVGRDQKDL